jgi:hypothetical protein
LIIPITASGNTLLIKDVAKAEFMRGAGTFLSSAYARDNSSDLCPKPKESYFKPIFGLGKTDPPSERWQVIVFSGNEDGARQVFDSLGKSFGDRYHISYGKSFRNDFWAVSVALDVTLAEARCIRDLAAKDGIASALTFLKGLQAHPRRLPGERTRTAMTVDEARACLTSGKLPVRTDWVTL